MCVKDILIPIVLLFLIAIVTEKALKSVRVDRELLAEQLIALEHEKKLEEAKQKKLKRILQSHSDPAWIELVLIRELGLLPEGQIKLIFKS